jgi:hypothetical protein
MKTPEQIEAEISNMNLSEVARVVRDDWKNVYFGAVPYLDAMSTMDSIKDNFLADKGTHIVNYFLGNAQTWRGPVARIVKKELTKRVKESNK